MQVVYNREGKHIRDVLDTASEVSGKSLLLGMDFSHKRVFYRAWPSRSLRPVNGMHFPHLSLSSFPLARCSWPCAHSAARMSSDPPGAS